MATHTFDTANFRARFPAFADETRYPDLMLEMYFEMATCYINPNDSCYHNGASLQLALELMTAHLLAIAGLIAGGDTSVGIVTSATIDKISVTQQVPQTPSDWAAFLLRSPYGQQLDALLLARGAGGFSYGGSRERAAIRKVGGFF